MPHFLCRWPFLRVELEHPPHQLDYIFAQIFLLGQVNPASVSSDCQVLSELRPNYRQVFFFEVAKAGYLRENSRVIFVFDDMAMVEEHFCECEPHGPDICLLIVGIEAEEALWDFVALGPEISGGEGFFGVLLGQSEVEQLCPSPGEEDVGRLDVSMHYSKRVHVCDGLGNILHVGERVFQLQLLHQHVQGSSWAEVEDQSVAPAALVNEDVNHLYELDVLVLGRQVRHQLQVVLYLGLYAFRGQGFEHFYYYFLVVKDV